MKRSLIVAGCSSLLALVVLADPVTSVNRVGYNRHTFEKGKIYLVATAFESIDGNVLKAQDVIGNQLPPGSDVFFYDGSPYKSDTLSGIPGVGWGSTIDFHGFMGFWVRVADTAPESSYEVVFKGQVPDASSSSNLVVNGLNMLGYPFTADVAFSNTALYANSVAGDALYIFDADANAYSSYSKSGIPGVGWGPAGEALVLRQGVGFWYQTSQGSLITEDRPYPVN